MPFSKLKINSKTYVYFERIRTGFYRIPRQKMGVLLSSYVAYLKPVLRRQSGFNDTTVRRYSSIARLSELPIHAHKLTTVANGLTLEFLLWR